MGDSVSMIFFTVSDEYTQNLHTAPRITREIFCYKDNVLLQSRLYPTDLEDQKTLYRSIVQQAIATCLDKPNLWSIKRGKEAEPYGESATDSNHYPDYKYGYAVASLLKGETDYIPMTIGSVARCVCCGGEQKSEKTSMRTRDRIRQIVSSGHFAGGFVPYGYRAINKGRVNKRDQPVKDLEINPDEAAWVREVFTKVAEEGASGYAMAQMLNQRGLRTRQGAEFQSSNIKRIIQHEGYTGYIITKAARSEFMPQLQIIDEALFAKANEMIGKRSRKAQKDKNAAQKSGNPTLLAGIVVCAHCGAKMSAFLHTDRYKLADGSIREKVQAKYNCYQRGQHLRECDGQALYLAERVGRIVVAYADELFRKIKSEPYDKSIEQRIRQQDAEHNRQKQAAEKKIRAAQYKQKRYEDEVLKCLEGESAFSQEVLARLIAQAEAEVRQAKDEYASMLQNNDDRTTVQQIRSYYDEFLGWANEFSLATVERKRAILAQLFEKVEIGKGYKITIHVRGTYRQFLMGGDPHGEL